MKRGQQQPVDLVPALVMSKPAVFQVGVAFLNFREGSRGRPAIRAVFLILDLRFPIGEKDAQQANQKSAIKNRK